MDEKTFVENIVKMREELKQLETQAKSLAHKIDTDIQSFSEENARFKVGDAVIYTKEKYKIPRKYFVRRIAFGVVERNNDGGYSYSRFYEISSANGYKPNGGWCVEEEYLTEYCKK